MVPMDTAERNLGGQQTRHIKHSINFTSNDIDRNSNNRETENYYLLSYHLSQHNVAMRLHRSILVAALAVATNLVQAAQLTFTIPTSPLLTNPSTLPPSTRATLYKHNNSLSVPLSRRNTFEFSDVSPGSWLFTVQCRDYAFGPLRVDVETTIGGDGDAEARREKVEVHQTFWGNEWRNKGERRGGAVAEPGAQARCIVEVKAERAKDYYMERAGFDPISFLKSPMILMALVSLVMIVGVPYLTDNMDPETKAEFEEMQRKSPLSQAGGSAGAAGLQNFDLAGFLAGSGKKS